MELPEMEVVEVHYWAVLIKDEFRPNGEEYPTRFVSQGEAERKLQRFKDIGMARRTHGRNREV